MNDNKTHNIENAILGISNRLCSPEEFYENLVSKYAWAEDYCYYYVYVAYVDRNDVGLILDSISLEDRELYTLQKAYFYLEKYLSKKVRMVTVIPTCNRPKTIKYLLEYVAVSYRKFGVDIIIYDSSTNDDTYDIVKEIRGKGFYNIMYKRYVGEFDGFSLDHKIMSAYDEFADEYDYLWVCRDGLIPVIEEIIGKLRYFKRKKIDCVIVDTKSRTGGLEIEKYYTSLEDCEELLLDQASRLQTLGMLIFSGDFARKLLDSEPLSEKNYSLWQMAAPFHAFVKNPYSIVFVSRNVFAFNPFAVTTHFWSSASKMMEQWAYRWYTVITSMPREYDSVKSACLMVYTIDFHPFSAKAIVEMRYYGGLSRKMLRKYEYYIEKVTMTPIWFFRLISIIPRSLAGLMLYISEKCPMRVSRIRRKIIADKRD